MVPGFRYKGTFPGLQRILHKMTASEWNLSDNGETTERVQDSETSSRYVYSSRWNDPLGILGRDFGPKLYLRHCRKTGESLIRNVYRFLLTPFKNKLPSYA